MSPPPPRTTIPVTSRERWSRPRGTVADGTAQQAWDAYIDALPRTSSGTSSSGSSSASDAEDSGGGNAVGVGAVVGVVVALAAVAAVWRVRRARRRTFSLPASVIAHVREAHDDRLEEQARAEVLALGEAIDAEDVDPSDEPVAWQAALDHYDGAKRVLSRGGGEPEVLDVVGAIVLARRGTRALADANAGREFIPAPLCYLNPLHAAPRGSSKVETGGRRVEVPLCAACQKDLQGGRAPDVLDVERRGRAVHYFDTDAEPWASTGYGTLKPDLVERLHGRRT